MSVSETRIRDLRTEIGVQIQVAEQSDAQWTGEGLGDIAIKLKESFNWLGEMYKANGFPVTPDTSHPSAAPPLLPSSAEQKEEIRLNLETISTKLLAVKTEELVDDIPNKLEETTISNAYSRCKEAEFLTQ